MLKLVLESVKPTYQLENASHNCMKISRTSFKGIIWFSPPFPNSSPLDRASREFFCLFFIGNLRKCNKTTRKGCTKVQSSKRDHKARKFLRCYSHTKVACKQPLQGFSTSNHDKENLSYCSSPTETNETDIPHKHYIITEIITPFPIKAGQHRPRIHKF